MLTPDPSDKSRLVYKTPMSPMSFRPDASKRISKKAERCRITKVRMGDLIAHMLDKTKDDELRKLDEVVPLPRRKKSVRTGSAA